jgi:hypothetical protein
MRVKPYAIRSPSRNARHTVLRAPGGSISTSGCSCRYRSSLRTWSGGPGGTSCTGQYRYPLSGPRNRLLKTRARALRSSGPEQPGCWPGRRLRQRARPAIERSVVRHGRRARPPAGHARASRSLRDRQLSRGSVIFAHRDQVTGPPFARSGAGHSHSKPPLHAGASSPPRVASQRRGQPPAVSRDESRASRRCPRAGQPRCPWTTPWRSRRHRARSRSASPVA